MTSRRGLTKHAGATRRADGVTGQRKGGPDILLLQSLRLECFNLATVDLRSTELQHVSRRGSAFSSALVVFAGITMRQTGRDNGRCGSVMAR